MKKIIFCLAFSLLACGEDECVVSILFEECTQIRQGKFYTNGCKNLKDKYYTVHKGNNLVYIEKIEDDIEKVKNNALKAQKEFCSGK